MSREDDYRRSAASCFDLARKAGSLADRTRLLVMAEAWLDLINRAGRDAAHLSDAIKFRGRTMVFSWPSKAGLFDYAYDRDSAMFSRDDFEHVLSSIVSAPGATDGNM
jgi:esterase/lipase superfamily enzyme